MSINSSASRDNLLRCASTIDFGQNYELIIHTEINHKINDKFCTLCGKDFARSVTLSEHIKHIHEGERNYKCDSCGKSFTESGNLKKHIKTIHEAQRNYKCDFCGKTFTESGTLKKHIKIIHEEQRNYKCDPC